MDLTLDKTIYVNELFDYYGELLPSRQKKMIIDYYENDLSLSEIAENENISRNAVYDALKKAEDSLIDYENKLHLYEKRNKYLSLLKKMLKSKQISEDTYNKLKGD